MPIFCGTLMKLNVTLHVSVWVEMPFITSYKTGVYVTLHVSVWVEIFQIMYALLHRRSRSTWACELKLERCWETETELQSRSTWACELKYRLWGNVRMWAESRSTWACELKLARQPYSHIWLSHAPRERVSWNNFINFQDTTGISHAPRERVSWNRRYLQTEELSQVTLHVSVWVEMPLRDMMWTKRLVTLHVSVWVEIPLKLLVLLPPRSRSTWACELKFNVSPAIVKGNVSRSTWACELKWSQRSYPHRKPMSRSTWACELKFSTQ